MIVAGVAGCGGGTKTETFLPVAGKVEYKGKPLATGVVIFTADADKGNTTPHEPRGKIDADGTFTVMTAGKPGAPPGWYRITVVANKPQDEKNPYAVPASLIPKHYADTSKSGLSAEVVASPPPGAYDFVLK
jgi:hypothetical protein